MPIANVLIGLGANLGDRLATLDKALSQLRETKDIELYRTSPWLESEPAGGPPNQPPFLNGAAWLKTTLSPDALLVRLHEIERALGRERREMWEARTIDLDLLLFDDLILNTPKLQIPHRWLPFRRFVLDPAVVLAPDWVHPILQKTIYELRVQLRAIPYWFVIDGGESATRDSLAAKLATRFNGFSLTPIVPGEVIAGNLPLRELPPRGVFISSVDWTKRASLYEQSLRLSIPAKDDNPTTAWQVAPSNRSWPLPKARIQLCDSEQEFLTTDWGPTLAPLYQALAPLPTLNLLTTQPETLFDQAETLLAALTEDA